MKVEEIRSALREWPLEDILKLFSIAYRRLPKETKEEIDELIQAGPKAKAAPKPKKPARRAFKDIYAEAEKLIDNATEGNYYYTNRAVSKKQRSNWRFTVKGLIKELETFQPGEPDYVPSCFLLLDIYDILGRATSFYTFASQDPYHTLGYESQRQCFQSFTDRVLKAPEEELLKRLIQAGCNGDNDYASVDCEFHQVLLEAFAEDLPHARALAGQLFAPVREDYNIHYKGRFLGMITEEQIICHSRYDSLVWFIAATYVWEGRPLDAYAYVREENPNGKNGPEIDLYHLLNYYANDRENFLPIYEAALKDGIKPREELQKQYQKLLKEES